MLTQTRRPKASSSVVPPHKQRSEELGSRTNSSDDQHLTLFPLRVPFRSKSTGATSLYLSMLGPQNDHASSGTLCTGRPPLRWLRLPAEIWSIIFSECLPLVSSFSPASAPTLLTQVCHGWRDMVLSTPTLWSNIALPGPVGALTPNTARLCGMWLERSQNCPLSVDLHLTSDFFSWVIGDKQADIVHEILMLFAKNSYRVKRLLRVLPKYLANGRVLRLSNMSVLEELLIREVRHGPDSSQDYPADLYLPPSLRSLSLRDTSIDLSHFSPLPPLRYLDLWQTQGRGRMSVSECLAILAELPFLETCGLYIAVNRNSASAGTRLVHVVLRNLRRLVISCPDDVDIGPMLDFLDTPALLALGLNACPATDLRKHLERFLTLCRHTITQLSLGNMGTLDTLLLKCLRLCKPSTHVTVCSCSFDNHLLAVMKETVGEVSLLPCLSFLTLETWRDFEAMHQSPRTSAFLSNGSQKRESVQLSLCKGISARHRSYIETWLAVMD